MVSPRFLTRCYDVLCDLVGMEEAYVRAVEEARGKRPVTRLEKSLQRGLVREAEKECTALVAPFLEASSGHMKAFVLELVEIGEGSSVSGPQS